MPNTTALVVFWLPAPSASDAEAWAPGEWGIPTPAKICFNFMPKWLTLIKYHIYPEGISLFSYSLAVQLPLLKGQHGGAGMKYAAAMIK